jgi:Mg-chelatase subunit ChlD
MKSAVSIALIASLVGCSAAESSNPDTTETPAPAPTEPAAEDPPEDAPVVEPMDPEEPEEPEDTTGFEECATQFDEAKLKPLDMVVMLDRSGSMADDGKWTAVTSAIQQFAANPDSQGIGVSLSYFPKTYSSVCLPCDSYCSGICFNGCCAPPTGEWCWNDGDCDGGGVCYDFLCHAGGGNATCEVGDYATPDVPLASLPGAVGQLNISMANMSPAGGTPTGPALQGALSYASDLAEQPNANDVVVVLATDGEPTECQPQSIGDVASVAASAAASPTAIPTFVIGVGANMFNLNVIAAAGGTQQAHLVDANASATQNFLDTLNEIRKVAVACQYEIPTVTGTIVYDLVNVAYAAAGQALVPIAKVTGASTCGISGGWHYDDPNAPTSIVMCPTTCEQLQNSDGTQVEIVYGCETILE